MVLERQRDLFVLALQKLARLGDLVNRALEAFELEHGSVEIILYDLPEPDWPFHRSNRATAAERPVARASGAPFASPCRVLQSFSRAAKGKNLPSKTHLRLFLLSMP